MDLSKTETISGVWSRDCRTLLTSFLVKLFFIAQTHEIYNTFIDLK